MVLFISYYQFILIPLWPVLWDYKVPIFEVPIMGTFTYADDARGRYKFLHKTQARRGVYTKYEGYSLGYLTVASLPGRDKKCLPPLPIILHIFY